MQESGDPQRPQLDTKIPLSSPAQRTQEYVQQHAQLDSDLQTLQANLPEPTSTSARDVDEVVKHPKDPCGRQSSEYSPLEFKPLPLLSTNPAQAAEIITPPRSCISSPKREPYNWSYGPYGGKFVSNAQFVHPQLNTSTHRPTALHHTDTSNLAKYLMRREMVSSGLLKFDDLPENYWAWKTSFRSAVQDLGLSSQEELDLISKWLGPQSAEQAERDKNQMHQQ